jgi:23S rRNA pseudouridine1911/1915/1917 synthase
VAWLERTYRDHSRPVRAFTFVVNAPEAGSRIDALLRSRFPWKSRTRFQAMLERGEALLNGGPAKASQRVRAGDRVEVSVPVDPAAPERESDEGIVVLYEDDRLLAVDKPSGMTVHPVGRIRHGTLINRLHARYRRDDPREDVVPRLAHRLDRDTSGVVLVVKDRETDARMTDAFTRRRVSKTYLALVRGVPADAEGWIDVPIGPAPDAATILQMAVRPDGAPSRTRWRTQRRFRRHALLAVEPLTGRTHQIRVHLAHLGHPVVCDHLYGDLRPLLLSAEDPAVDPFADRAVLSRLGLHAHRLELEHPWTGERLVVESPLPPDLVGAVADLDAARAGASR